MQKVIAVLPARNVAKTLNSFLSNLPIKLFDEIILFDDASTDSTLNIAKKQRILKVYSSKRRLGYGGALKKCFAIALAHKADIIVEIHPDGEYKPDGITPALKKIKKGARLVLGDRFSASRKGMRYWKIPTTKTLSAIDNLILGTKIKDFHQGFRVYTKELLKKVQWQSNSNGYIFSFEIIAQAVYQNSSIASVPVSTRYTGKRRGLNFIQSIVYALKTFWVLSLFILSRLGYKNTQVVFK